MKTIRVFVLALAAVLCCIGCGRKLRDGEYHLTILSTDDIHGTWFDSTYVGGGQRNSLLAINWYIDSVRTATGAGNVVLLDVGDCLQGDNAAYYYNYIDTVTPHLFPRLMGYMGYDAVAIGNHDIETGHRVYDRVGAQLESVGAPWLGGNCIRNSDGKPYFPLYKVLDRAGLKIAVIGYGNANIKAWLNEELWSGMHFEPIVSVIQKDVDMVRAKEKPDVVIAMLHSATGEGDGSILEAEALDVLNSVNGVDWVLCGHDHRPFVEARDDRAILNSGSHCRFLAEGKMTVTVEGGRIVSKEFAVNLIPIDKTKADPVMREHFQADFNAVRAFTLQEVGILNTELVTRDAFKGMCPYINLLHTLSLSCAPAQISFAAPLTYNGKLNPGILIYNDLFTIYPFENQLYVVSMTGAEILSYLEISYDGWIQTLTSSNPHVLKITPRDDSRSGSRGWSFVNRSYNFDSAGGLNYTVDVTKPFGERVSISSLADGSAFDAGTVYNVAMTSYRASGGGELLKRAGVDSDNIDSRVVARYPEIRNILYDYITANGSIDPEVIGNPAVIGSWKFVPEQKAVHAIDADMALLFPRR